MPASTHVLQRIASTTICAALGALFGVALPISAQQSTNRLEGLREQTPRWHAITGARIVIAPGREIARGTLVMRDGRIVAVGADVAIPAGARVWKMDGRVLYAGMIDLSSSVGVPAGMRPAAPTLPPWLRPPGMSATPAGATTATPRSSIATQNRAVRAELDVADQLDWKADDVKALREQGFTSALATPALGVFRGQSALLNLADSSDAKAVVLQTKVAQHIAHEAGAGFDPSARYPASTMGAIALARQTLYDARWVSRASAAAGERADRVEANASLAALQPVLAGKQPVVYLAESEQDYQRVARVRDEFSLRVMLKGNGYEYRRVAQLKQLAMPVIVPLNFPPVPEVENPDSAIDVSLENLQHWEQAPGNTAALANAGVEFAISADGLRDVKEFWPQLRLAVRRGLRADAALAALTTIPAKLLNQNALGTLEVGKLANVLVATDDLFSNDSAEIDMLFVDGRR